MGKETWPEIFYDQENKDLVWLPKHSALVAEVANELYPGIHYDGVIRGNGNPRTKPVQPVHRKCGTDYFPWVGWACFNPEPLLNHPKIKAVLSANQDDGSDGKRKEKEQYRTEGLLSMLDEKETTLNLHQNWGQVYLSNLPATRKTAAWSGEGSVPYRSIAIYFDTDQHNLTFLCNLRDQVEDAIRWLEEKLAEKEASRDESI